MKKQFVRVPVRGMTAEEVLALWQEGKLYREEETERVSDEELLAHCQQEALAYVAAIDDFAVEEWKPYVKKVWEAVLRDETFAAGLLMRQKRQLNRYFLTCLVINMQTLGVYRPVEEVSQLQLHLTLEHVTAKNCIFKSCGKYPVTSAQRKHLRALLNQFQ